MSSNFSFEPATELINNKWEEPSGVVEVLSDYIRIPNQSPSFDPECLTNGYQEQAIELLIDWVKRQNVPDLSLDLITEPGRTPLIFIEVPATDPSLTPNSTVLLYGHMDKQPPLTEQWAEGLHPYTPVMRDGKLYGRGGADDGYAVFAAVTAINALKQQNIPHTRCVIVIEACEESGSPDLPFYIQKYADRIGTPALVICLDSGCGNYEQFWLTTSLRGLVVGTLTVKILNEGCHSGKASGIVPSTFRIIRQLLARVENENTGEILVPEFLSEIPEHRIEQTKLAAEVLGQEIVNEFPFVDGSHPPHSDYFKLLLGRNWHPALSYTGVDGIPSLANAGNVLRTQTSIKLSMRLPPNVSAATASQALKAILEKDPPYGAHVSFSIEKAGSGWESPALAPWLQTVLEESSTRAFGKTLCYIGEGGSIPFMGMLGEKFPEAQFVITGVLGPGSNAHGPNEFLHVEMSKRVTIVCANVLATHAQRYLA